MVILLRAPSRFFVESFHAASFYLPAMLTTAGVLLLTNRARPVHLMMLGGSVIPFFTVALAFRIGSGSAIGESPITAGLVTAVGVPVSMIASVLLAALEVAGMAYLWYLYRGHDHATILPRSPGSSSSPETLVDLPEPDVDPDSETPDRGADEAPIEAVAVADERAPIEVEPVGDPLELAFENGRFVQMDDPDDLEDTEGDPSDETQPTHRGAREPRSLSYQIPIEGLLEEYKDGQYWRIDDDTRTAAETLRFTLEEFGIQAEVTGIRKGPVITMFELLPAPGVKLSKIVNLADNIALRLAASSVRIVAPIPGKHAVGIEIPNAHRAIVGFAELLREESFRAPKMEIPIALGKDIPGEAQIVDLTRMPHVLIAGATGSGKSVCVNSIICSILYRQSPAEVKMILIDPKIVELKFYNDIPHLLTPVVTDPRRAFQALQYCIYEMERRYTLLDALQVRDVQSYNRKIVSKQLATEPIPYIVVVVDEFADLMATSGKELESTLARLAAMSRAVGIHLVLATQRPSTDVITGLIKANIPSRIAFMVASKIDSRIIIDAQGAEKLLGGGDMLFTSAWDPFPLRLQGAYLSEEEVERVVEYVKQLGKPDYIDDEIFLEEDDEDYVQGELEDPLMEKAVDIVVTANKASASYLQRRLKIGYNRAARMVEEMERLGFVGPQQGSKAREIIGMPDRR
ncbi:MAG: DNA translocase FtsK [Spirochaetales bacterium]|nr:DNA translocase FtsK [Spirochaetales bacterium]